MKLLYTLIIFVFVGCGEKYTFENKGAYIYRYNTQSGEVHKKRITTQYENIYNDEAIEYIENYKSSISISMNQRTADYVRDYKQRNSWTQKYDDDTVLRNLSKENHQFPEGVSYDDPSYKYKSVDEVYQYLVNKGHSFPYSISFSYDRVEVANKWKKIE